MLSEKNCTAGLLEVHDCFNFLFFLRFFLLPPEITGNVLEMRKLCEPYKEATCLKSLVKNNSC